MVVVPTKTPKQKLRWLTNLLSCGKKEIGEVSPGLQIMEQAPMVAPLGYSPRPASLSSFGTSVSSPHLQMQVQMQPHSCPGSHFCTICIQATYTSPYAHQSPLIISTPRETKSSPWTVHVGREEVLDTVTGLATLGIIDTTINPNITASAGPTKIFPLVMDLRMPHEGIWKRPKPGHKEKVEKWTDIGDAATLPLLSHIVLVGPYWEGSIAVDNHHGITCEDIIESLYNYGHQMISKEQFNDFSWDAQGEANYWYRHHRALRNAAMPKGLCHLDFWQGKVSFEGLRKDDDYVTKRMGWAHPAAFVVELKEPSFNWKQPWTLAEV